MARHQGWKPHVVIRRNGNGDIWMARAGQPGEPYVATVVDVNCPSGAVIDFTKGYCNGCVFFRNTYNLFRRNRESS